MMKIKIYLIGFLSFLIGIIYIVGLYGPTEAEVGRWGIISIILGCWLMLCNLYLNKKILDKLKIIIIIIILLIQIPPIYLWFVFYGRGISDGTPPSTFIAHWGYSIPHIIIVILCIISINNFIKNKLIKKIPKS